ncbi:putative methyltransferase [Pyrodictium delaneyi]|uniref:Putative methyltransferase n=1 Tax=Pyrodictium delaneyi TaxID=1273541 RepID=A0A0P0N4F9_9CREN|nr:class I SAM-dependent methyltransferase [Pyrodictium delaneyi]ALL01328.1 putative methyltransferase [Pyrodictium delaneyi]OWJ53840.1 SAM-dependent methyltransferase [Pyrodictium delaneyi]
MGLRGRGLEVGVGTGWFASRLSVEYGVDPSPGMLRVARSRGVEAVLGVGENLPFRSNVFDYVLLIVTLCFVDEPAAVLQEAARVAKPGGAVAACIVPRDSMWGRYYMEQRRNNPFYAVARFYTVREIEAIMREAGLIVEAYSSVLRFPPWAEPRVEEPEPTPKGGFVCIKARRSQPLPRAALAR